MTGPVPRRAVRIGLTGPIGCGKSTIAGWLAELGAVVIDADSVARTVLEPGEPASEAVLVAFGAGVRAKDGAIDRAALARLVFNDADALARLEAIVHPAVRPRILAAVADADSAGAPAVVIEAIKLVEGGLAALCDEVWLVTCDAPAQAARLGERGMEPADASQRIAAQAGQWASLRGRADVHLDSSGTMGETRVAVAEAFEAAVRSRRP